MNLLSNLVILTKTGDNISTNFLLKSSKQKKLYAELLSISKELVSCYQEKVALEHTMEWITLLTIDNLCELGYHFFQCTCLLSLFNESLVETVAFEFMDLLLPVFPPFSSIEEDENEEMDKEKKIKDLNLQELKNLSESIFIFVNSVSENEVYSQKGIRMIQQYIYLLNQTVKNLIPSDAISPKSTSETEEVETKPMADVKINWVNPERESGVMYVYEGQSEKPNETVNQSQGDIGSERLASLSTLSEIHNQLFVRDSGEPTVVIGDSSMNESSETVNEERATQPLNKNPSETVSEEECTEVVNDSRFELISDIMGQRFIERFGQWMNGTPVQTMSYYSLHLGGNSGQNNETNSAIEYTNNSLPKEVMDEVLHNGMNFVVYDRRGEATAEDASTILSRIKAGELNQQAAQNGNFSTSGGVCRYRDNHGNAEMGQEIRRVVSGEIEYAREKHSRGEKQEESEGNRRNRRENKLKRKKPQHVSGAGDGEFQIDQEDYAMAAASQSNSHTPNSNTNDTPSDSLNAGSDKCTVDNTDDYSVDEMTPDELARHMNYYPLAPLPFNQDISVFEYLPKGCLVSNKHSQNMIQILTKCKT